jgi:uncharacterized RmlC-like cupin family protein
MTARCIVVQAGDAAAGATEVHYAAGISKATAGATGLSLQLASLPPGARARAHLHAKHESAAYMLEGEAVLWFGERLEEKVVARTGDFMYIPHGVPHVVANASEHQPAVVVLARTDADEQEDVTALPDLDSLPHVQPAPRQNDVGNP